MDKTRKSAYHNVIYLSLLQNLFCINRTHCLEKTTHRIFGQIIYFTSVSTVICGNIFDIFTRIKFEREVYLTTSAIFAYTLEGIIGLELIVLAVLAKLSDNFYEKLELLENKCELTQLRRKEQITNNNSKKIIILSSLSVIVDLVGLNYLNYSLSVVITLTAAFAAHDTELLLYSRIIEVFNFKLRALREEGAVRGVKMYRHILIAVSHFTEEFKSKISFMVVMTLVTTVLYIGLAVAMEGPRKYKVFPFFAWRELRSLFSLWVLCSAAHRTRALYDGLVQRLSERIVFELDSNNEMRKMTKKWLKCIKITPVRYLAGSPYSLKPVLLLYLLDYTANYFLIITQMYPVIMKVRRDKLLASLHQSV